MLYYLLTSTADYMFLDLTVFVLDRADAYGDKFNVRSSPT